MTATFHVGDTRAVTASLPDASVDLILTSPPFLALRSYLPADHPDKGKEIGSESNPAAFIDVLLELTAEWRRILAPHGSIVIELGDTYSGSGGAGGDYSENGWREGQAKFEGSARHRIGRVTISEPPQWPLPKSLALVPELYRVALAYGINPLTGNPSPAGRWRVRNVVRWVRPNPPVGALGDKWRPATSDLVVACIATDRYFDLDATRSTSTTRSTNGASFDTATVGCELDGTLHTGDRSHVTRWWCDFSKAEIAVDGAVARNAEGLEIRQLIGIQIGVETPEGDQVMNLEAASRPASLASIEIAVKDHLANLMPVGSAIVDSPAPICGALLATPVGTTPSSVALKAAEVVHLEGARVAGDLLAARLTLKLNGSGATACLIAPFTGGELPARHTNSLAEIRSNHAGAPPLDWWQIVPGGYSGKTSTTRQVPCGPLDGGQRTTSPDCPIHADLPGQLPKALRDARAETSVTDTPRIGNDLVQALLDDSVPTDLRVALGIPLESSDSTDLPCGPSAMPHSKASNRTAPAPATSPLGTPSAETTDRTERTPTSPESDGHRPDTSASSISGPPSTAESDLGTPPRTADTASPDRSCTCSFTRSITESTSHYAVWPPALCERPIEAMCPRRVCTTCGRPSRRITGEPVYTSEKKGHIVPKASWIDGGERLTQGAIGHDSGVLRTAPTVGWSSCGCPNTDGLQMDGYHTGTGWRAGLVLDPFVGSGTTLVVAHGHSRDSIGIDLDPRNADLAKKRLGMFVEMIA